MSKLSTSVKMRRRNGVLFRVRDDGSEEQVTVGTPKRRRTEKEVVATALSDSDLPPLTAEDFKRMRRMPRVKTLRRALGFTQEEFAAHYHIPLGTLRDWEQGRSEPDQPARAYLRIIAQDPERVRLLLRAKPAHAAA